MSKKTRLPSGTWVTKELLRSRAFFSLSGNAKQILLEFMLKRDFTKQHVCRNCNNLTLTYKELENILGEDSFGKPQGFARASITRALDNLARKGFIKIIRRGGAYQRDKTVYGLTEDWKNWSPGREIRSRTKGIRKSRDTSAINFNPQNVTHTHPQDEGVCEKDNTPSL